MKTIDGRDFNCIKCGACCRWDGVVVLKKEDLKRLSDHLGEEPGAFLNKYTKKHMGYTVLQDRAETKECIFIDGNKCKVWDFKPKQCDDFPIEYDKRCPGFNIDTRSASMSDKYERAVKAVSQKLSGDGNFDKDVLDSVFNGLQQTIKSASIVTVASESGIDPFLSNNKMRVASLDDLFSFDRIGSNQLIHKCTRDLWAIDSDKDGAVQITRLFDNSGEPVKG